MATDYVFRRMIRADLALIQDWLVLPHVREWWGEPDEQYALVGGDLDEPAMDQYIVCLDGAPFGYLQCYDLTAWNTVRSRGERVGSICSSASPA
jgi:aminoglycoside 6'-N-acetyltransferase